MTESIFRPRKIVRVAILFGIVAAGSAVAISIPRFETGPIPRLAGIAGLGFFFPLIALLAMCSLRLKISDDGIDSSCIFGRKRLARDKSFAARVSFFGLAYTLLADDENALLILDRALTPDFDVRRVVPSVALLELTEFRNERTRRRFYSGRPIVFRGVLLFVTGSLFFVGLILWQPSKFTSISPLLILPIGAVGGLLVSFVGLKAVTLVDGKVQIRQFGTERRYVLDGLQYYRDGWLGRNYIHSDGKFLLIEYHPANSVLSQIIDARHTKNVGD